jgi:P4 family phage/plasmid primase-like protien
MAATTTTSLAVPAITNDMSTLDAALAYAIAGFYIGPCKRGSKHPGSVLGDNWELKTSRDPAMIVQWFAGTDHGIFLHMGRSGGVAIDVDNPNKLHPAIQQAISQYHPPYQSTRANVPGRGHYVFAMPEGRRLGNSLGELGKGWGEIRGLNGVIIVAPSKHQERDGRYEWCHTVPVSVPTLPGYVASRLPDAEDAAEAATDEEVEAFLAEHTNHQRPDLLDVHIAAWQKKITAGESRHDSMMGHAAGAMKEAKAGLIDAKVAAVSIESVFVPAIMQQPSGSKQGKARTPAEAENEWRGILAWAVAQGKASDPAKTHERVNREVPPPFTEVPFEPNGSTPNGSTPNDASEPASKPATYTATDDGNALKLITEHRHRLRRVADMKKWFVWDGCRWAQDHEDRATREAARELARLLPANTKDQATFKRNSMSATGVSSAVRLAETDPRISIRAAELDAHPDLINTPSGVVDLRTATVKPHDPNLLLTRITAYAVDLEAPHPRWDKFLADTFQSDLELVAYMRRIAGLALSGFVREHVLPFLHGVGANGKTVFANVIQGLLGEADLGGYALSAPDGFLMAGRDNVHPTEIARLRGARLAICSEQTSGKRFDETKVKRLTGGDVLTGRFMRADFFDFHPSHLILVLSNHLPAVGEGGPAFWRRVRRIPFLHVVPEDQRVPDLADQLLADEGPAILAWAVRGAAQVLSTGLADPPAVLAATEEYRVSEDTIASFVRDECLLGSGWWCKISDLRARYEQHCDEMGADPISGKALGMRLTTEYPVTSSRHTKLKVRTYIGIGLQVAADEQTEGGDR